MLGASRYDGVEVATTTVPDGGLRSATSGAAAPTTREVRYLRRRQPPPAPTQPPIALHRVADDDRLDLVAARYLGDPLAAWRIADANAALDPLAVTATPGDVVVVPTPEL
ncbi:MAG: hypothetical protein ACOH2F_05830 [Cellulomonas sp.]